MLDACIWKLSWCLSYYLLLCARISITGVEGRLSSSREREEERGGVLDRAADLSLPTPAGELPETEDFRGFLPRDGELLRDVLLFVGEDGRDLHPLDGEELRDLTGDDERDAWRDEGLDLES